MQKMVTKTIAGLILIVSLLAYQTANSAQLEGMYWESTDLDNTVLALNIEGQADHSVSVYGQGGIIELVLEKTGMDKDLKSPDPQGIVRSLIVVSDEDDIKFQFFLAQQGKLEVLPSEGGLQVVLKHAAASENSAISNNSSKNEGQTEDGRSQFKALRFSRIGGNRVQVDLSMEGDVKEPVVFRTVAPPRIAIDFYNVTNRSGETVFSVGISSLDSVLVAEDDRRMRVVLNLTDPVDYDIIRVEDGYVLVLGMPATGTGDSVSLVQETAIHQADQSAPAAAHFVKSVDFRRTPGGGGRVILELSDSSVAVDLNELGPEIVAHLKNTSIPAELEHRLDVIDFATPVTYIDTYNDGRDARMVVTMMSDRFKQSSVQSGSTLVLEISPLTETEEQEQSIDEFGYKGEKLSLNFQEISVRSALQVIADFTGLNFVTSDAIVGNLSLRLKDVPWDQALDVILQTKGLAMRQKGNVVWVAPATEIAAKEKQALSAQQEKTDLEPLVSELIRVSYAKVEDIAQLIKSVKAVDAGLEQSAFGNVTLNETVTVENSLLSDRGSVNVDVRTNSILIQDTATKLKELKVLIAKLDIPVRQVQIETRIVEANDDFSRNIGARLGFTRVAQNGSLGDSFSSGNLNNTNLARTESATDFSDDALSVNLPAGAIGEDFPGSYAFTIAKLGSGYLNLLDLELSALEAEGNGKILANPKILTTDKRSASIEQGQERLTTFGSAFGAAATRGQRAVLSLTVLPQITPDDKVILDVDITNDSFVAANTDTVNTKRIDTQVLLENGETVVIGGIYTQEETFSVAKVPILGDIPILGALFRKKTARNNRSELLIFLTPRIIDPTLTVQ